MAGSRSSSTRSGWRAGKSNWVPEAGATVAALLEAAAIRLRQAGSTEPRREAWRIWADLEEQAGRRANPAERERDAAPGARERYQRAVARRAAGEPLAYVTGLAGFRRLTLRADRRALIPRPETEGLVELMLAKAPAGRIADVGTGGGCVALALADEGRYDLVVAVDRSREALALARENRTRTGLPISLVLGDLLLAFEDRSLDAVVSNPPYLTEAEYGALDRSVRDWEPADALASGTDGLAATRRLIEQATRVTRPGGWLGLEVDSTRAPGVARFAGESGWIDTTVHMDLFDRARYVFARRSEAE
jgi:release factor glutamine methyltransferase